jgi:hypothetical protein
MARETVAVVVPVYKREMDELERLSLSRCAAVLGEHPQVLIGPKSLDFGGYREVLPAAHVLRFDDRYFTGLAGYSELLVSPCFYQAFASYEFILVCQPDAFVFADRLRSWCERGCDYVGAPWQDAAGQWRVGNGGFSLRRVDACLEVLRCRRRLSAGELWGHVRRTVSNPLARALRYHRKVLCRLGLTGDLPGFLRRWVRRGEPEDMFWGLHAPRWCPDFRLAPVEEAFRFAVEAGLETAFPSFAEGFPFGCHRSWYLEMIQRFLKGDDGPRSGRERMVWEMARMAGLARPASPADRPHEMHSCA